MKPTTKAPEPRRKAKRATAGTNVAVKPIDGSTVVPASDLNRNTLRMGVQVGKTDALQMAEALINPSATNAAVAQRFASYGGQSALGITEAMEVMAAASTAVQRNDLSAMEGLLTSQALSLNVMFAELARRGALHMGTPPRDCGVVHAPGVQSAGAVSGYGRGSRGSQKSSGRLRQAGELRGRAPASEWSCPRVPGHGLFAM